MNILIIEDHPSICKILELMILEKYPKAIINITEELNTSLEFIKKIKPEFVITDIQLGNFKQIEILEECEKFKIPCMVFSSYINATILEQCITFKVNVVVAKSSSIEDLQKGIYHLLSRSSFRCTLSTEINKTQFDNLEYTPKVIFTAAEESVILAQIAGKSTVELSKDTRKSKYTIRNQRMKLMEKNECTMEEIVRRYLFWHTKG